MAARRALAVVWLAAMAMAMAAAQPQVPAGSTVQVVSVVPGKKNAKSTCKNNDRKHPDCQAECPDRCRTKCLVLCPTCKTFCRNYIFIMRSPIYRSNLMLINPV